MLELLGRLKAYCEKRNEELHKKISDVKPKMDSIDCLLASAKRSTFFDIIDTINQEIARLEDTDRCKIVNWQFTKCSGMTAIYGDHSDGASPEYILSDISEDFEIDIDPVKNVKPEFCPFCGANLEQLAKEMSNDRTEKEK